jgi:hypothetical protein
LNYKPVAQFWNSCTVDENLMIVENKDGIQPINEYYIKLIHLTHICNMGII